MGRLYCYIMGHITHRILSKKVILDVCAWLRKQGAFGDLFFGTCQSSATSMWLIVSDCLKAVSGVHPWIKEPRSYRASIFLGWPNRMGLDSMVNLQNHALNSFHLFSNRCRFYFNLATEKASLILRLEELRWQRNVFLSLEGVLLVVTRLANLY